MKKKIKVFTTPTCPYCVMVKQFLTEKNVSYEDIDVSLDQKAATQMFEKSHQMGVPQLWIGDEVIVGFDPGRINDLIKDEDDHNK